MNQYSIEILVRGGGSVEHYCDSLEEAQQCFEEYRKNPNLVPDQPVKSMRLFKEIEFGELFIVDSWKNTAGRFKRGELKELRRIQSICAKERGEYDWF
ncbi:MAG: hypothetical protein WC428_07840 [Candidatus Paceibacterota bacterium]|jgi:hypothetical protein